MTVRLDALLVQQNLAPSREKAKQIIQSGHVLIQGKPVRKPAALVEQDVLLSITSPGERFVSRGGYKLEKALNDFSHFFRIVVLFRYWGLYRRLY